MRRTPLFFITVTLVLSLDARARTVNLVEKCTEPSTSKISRLNVSAARTGQRIEAPYPHVDQLEIVIEDKNPYKFRYRMTLDQRPLEAIMLRDFLSPLSDFSEMLAAVTGASLPSDTKNKLREVLEEKSDNPLKMLINKIAELKQDVGAYNGFLAMIRTDVIDCEGVAQSAQDLLPNLMTLRDVSALRARVDKVVDTAQAAVVGDPIKANREFLANSQALSRALSTIEKKSQDFENLRSLLLEIGGAKSPFFDLVNVKKLGGATATTVEVYRTNRLQQGAVEELVASIKVDMGTVRLSVSAGIGFSTVDEVKIVRQASSDGMGGVTNKFGFENNSDFKPAGVVMLNGHVVTKPSLTFGPSVGLVVSRRGSEPQLEYLLGASFGFKDNLVWLTGGLHAARVAELSGFSIGDDVPVALQDPIPTEESFKPGFMFAITFKIR